MATLRRLRQRYLHLATTCLIACVSSLGAAVLAQPAYAQQGEAPEVSLRLTSEGAYVGVPFTLVATVSGFDENQAPPQPPLSLPGATVKLGGVRTDASQSISITINGKRTVSRDVSLSYSYEITASKAGTLNLPSLTFSAGGKRASSRPARITVETVPTSRVMQLRSNVPERPVYVGEAIAVSYEWTITENIDPVRFEVPLLGMTDAFAVSAPKQDNADVKLPVTGGASELSVGAVGERTNRGNTYKFTLLVTPLRAGRIAIPPAFVLGRTSFGSFGFGDASLTRAQDVAHTLDVKQLPITGQPASFHGAVGTSFSFVVRASRSVVALGEPMELEVVIKSDARLDTTVLGSLVGPGALPATAFAAETDAPVGELSADGMAKTFRVPVQVIGNASEIPAIAFSYFDPTTATYKTIHSEPIALSVRDSDMVGAAQVARSTAGANAGVAASGPKTLAGLTSLVGADLALSGEGERGVPLSTRAWFVPTIWALYLASFVLLMVSWWLARSRGRRTRSSERSTHRRALLARLDAAATQPARDVAPALAAAFREYCQTVGVAVPKPDVLQRLEVEAFAPTSGNSPLAAALLSEIRTMTTDVDRAAAQRPPTRATTATLLLVASALALPLPSYAQPAREPAPGRAPTTARTSYQSALSTAQGPARDAAFAQAEALFAQAAIATPTAPVLTDWGNAALGAGQIGKAVLAYRRALAADASYGRAIRNLRWIRGQLGQSAHVSASAADTLFFFHQWPRSWRWLASALVFFVLALSLSPGVGNRLRGARPVVILGTGMAWALLVGSLAWQTAQSSGGHDAVVLVSTALHAADSENAPLATPAPLPAGTEVTILEQRGSWQKVRLGQGTSGWIRSATSEAVALPPS